MILKKYVVFLLVIVFAAMVYVSTNSRESRLWSERSEKAFAQKNTSYGLLYLLRAERAAGLAQRFSLVKSRVLLDKAPKSTMQFAGEVAREFFVSLSTAMSPLMFQLLALFLLFCGAFLIGSFGLAATLRAHKDLVVITLVVIGFLVHSYQVGSMQRAVLLPHSVTLVSGPGETFAHVGSVVGPRDVWVREQTGDFVKIQAGGLSGWIMSKNVKIV